MFWLLGLVGHPVEHSLSPPMHKAALSHFGLDGDYRLLDIEPDLIERGLAEIVSQKYAGFNVTVPHKQALVHLARELTPEATQVSAVNAVKIDEKGLVGHNTDLGGFVVALSDSLPSNHHQRIAYILGAGGAARAAVWGLMNLGWPKIKVVARNPEAAEALLEEIAGPRQKRQLPQTELSWAAADSLSLDQVPDLVVNCTPIGLGDSNEVPEWVAELLRWMDPEGTFFDMVYARQEVSTPLIKEARRLRLNCVDGTEMLVQQAALSLEFWTGKSVPREIMRQALRAERSLVGQVARESPSAGGSGKPDPHRQSEEESRCSGMV